MFLLLMFLVLLESTFVIFMVMESVLPERICVLPWLQRKIARTKRMNWPLIAKRFVHNKIAHNVQGLLLCSQHNREPHVKRSYLFRGGNAMLYAALDN
jgi:hypothetical protein